MKCPYCGFGDDKVVDSRPSNGGSAIRRRRECLKCGKRYTTYERVEPEEITVIKKDGRREQFSREKLKNGIKLACKKRNISVDLIEKMVEDIKAELMRSPLSEIPTSEIGERVMRKLRELDEVAYVRFASVYRQFQDKDEFLREVAELGGKSED